eukprot:m.49186 g.49186  ORF g.49186 m.49186 type:complete len:349 (+) comp8947_c0_seq1:81-1127(+)
MAQPDTPRPVVAFSLTAIAHPDRPEYALVHEKQVRGWWLPGGGVDAGQTLAEAAVREADEEAGCKIRLTGVLRVEFTPTRCRLRVIWGAVPIDPAAPLKTVPDAESRGALWVTLDETSAIAHGKKDVEHCYLRGPEPLFWFTHLESHAKGGIAMAAAELVRCTRHGSVPEWAGSGSPPRAMYPTITTAEAIVVRADTRCVLGRDEDGVLTLPAGPLVGDAVEPGARAAAIAALAPLPPSTVALLGVAQFHHTLHVAAPDASAHSAEICVTYVYTASGGELDGLEGCVWAPVDDPRWGADPLVVLNKAASGGVYPASIVCSEECCPPDDGFGEAAAEVARKATALFAGE